MAVKTRTYSEICGNGRNGAQARKICTWSTSPPQTYLHLHAPQRCMRRFGICTSFRRFLLHDRRQTAVILFIIVNVLFKSAQHATLSAKILHLYTLLRSY